MDYSLVVGVDSDRHELVVGIVDYIRTFTWSVARASLYPQVSTRLIRRDKKLESWVKDSTFLGGAGKGEPTIVTPKQCTWGKKPWDRLMGQIKRGSGLRWRNSTFPRYRTGGARLELRRVWLKRKVGRRAEVIHHERRDELRFPLAICSGG
jgi:hypothetical protein